MSAIACLNNWDKNCWNTIYDCSKFATCQYFSVVDSVVELHSSIIEHSRLNFTRVVSSGRPSSGEVYNYSSIY